MGVENRINLHQSAERAFSLAQEKASEKKYPPHYIPVELVFGSAVSFSPRFKEFCRLGLDPDSIYGFAPPYRPQNPEIENPNKMSRFDTPAGVVEYIADQTNFEEKKGIKAQDILNSLFWSDHQGIQGIIGMLALRTGHPFEELQRLFTKPSDKPSKAA